MGATHDFCNAYQSTCVSKGYSAAYDDCVKEFEAYDTGSLEDKGGPSTQGCRRYHLSLATDDDSSKIHCPHASANGGEFCVAPATTDFCSTYQSTCVSNGYSAAYDDCVKEFEAYDIGSLEDKNGPSTQGCR